MYVFIEYKSNNNMQEQKTTFFQVKHSDMGSLFEEHYASDIHEMLDMLFTIVPYETSLDQDQVKG